MGGSGSVAKKCVIQSDVYNIELGKLIVLGEAIEKLAQGIAKNSLSSKTILKPLPQEMVTDPSSFLLPGDTAVENAVTRYNGFVGFFGQLQKENRLSIAADRLDELVQLRENAATAVANLCI